MKSIDAKGPDLAFPLLDVRDLRVIFAVARAGTTGKASTALHLTQPAVSRALLLAEERLGARVFDRTPRGLVLTPQGEALVLGATPLLRELAELEQRVRAPAVTTRIRLVCECYTAYHWLPSALVSLGRTLPNVRLELSVEHTTTPVEALVAGEIDVALLTNSPVSRGLVERPLFADEVVFVLSSSHPLAKKKALTRDDLRATTLVTSRGAEQEARWFMTRVFGRARPRLRFERLPLTEAILDVTRAGLGIAILSEWIASPHLGRGDLVVKRLSSGPLHRPWRLAFRPEVSASAEPLLLALRASLPRARLAS